MRIYKRSKCEVEQEKEECRKTTTEPKTFRSSMKRWVERREGRMQRCDDRAEWKVMRVFGIQRNEFDCFHSKSKEKGKVVGD